MLGTNSLVARWTQDVNWRDIRQLVPGYRNENCILNLQSPKKLFIHYHKTCFTDCPEARFCEKFKEVSDGVQSIFNYEIKMNEDEVSKKYH